MYNVCLVHPEYKESANMLNEAVLIQANMN